MKNILFIILFSLSTVLAYSQARVVINNNGFIVIDNSAFLVLDNGAANALATAGTGGKIISESETDVIKWNVGTATGVHSIPWATSVATGSVKIPLSINITAAGVGAGNILLSTYETTTDANLPWQSGITNMCSSTTNLDGSLLVADRFWQINANTYGTKPAVNMTIGYNPAANELAGGNTLIESNLEAQRFNPGAVASSPCYAGAGSWETLLFGTNNAPSDNVTSIVVSPADFFKDWILTDRLSPLPVELVSFDVDCNQGEVEIEWTTQTEINNDYFVVEKSYDAVSFFELTMVQGAGNSSVVNYYSVIDPNPSSGVTYYRLKQVDFDGTVAYHEIASSSCNPKGFTVDQLVLNNNTLSFNITTIADEDVIVYFYDYRGRIISNKAKHIESGNNAIELTNLEISTGIYMLSIIGEKNTFATKLMNVKN
ncbi:MAG: T9SS type A sorting domain-containing protein [Flavobacteriales bacterium]|nr:T9SS type A sorting domain-containing protein [Flavobacteriales bacterium]